ncbi:MAG: rRNA maturation RNase YbeY [Oscillospiraceae bacterium]|jgi:probable rRNA maturation factor|nr:rRNA maturation RNase YbeY [Oscillospiraceae bacterium]
MEKIRVIISNRQNDIKIPTGLRMVVRRCCNAVLKMEEFKGSVAVSVVFVSSEQIRQLNEKYRGKNVPTDVLSFPVNEERGIYDVDIETGEKLIGDVVISIERAIDQSKKYGHSLQREVAYLTAHSVLHLLGYNHEEGLERVRMREKEEKVMTQLGLPGTSSYVLGDV